MIFWTYALILAGLAMLGPFTTDTYFPFFPDLQRYFGIQAASLQQSLSLYLLSFSIMMLFHGSLSDAFGRRRVILWSLAGFILTSLACAMAHSYAALLLFRALQGMCVGAGMVVGQAIIRDRFHGVEAQRLVSQVTMLFGLAPALAPLVGGYLHQFFPWQSAFILLAGLGGLLWLACFTRLDESLQPNQRQPFRLGYLWTGYRVVFFHRPFMLLSTSLALGFSGFLVYVASAPDVVFHVLAQDALGFGWLFVPIVIGLMGGSMCATWYAGKLSHGRMLRAGYATMALAVMVNLAYTLMTPEVRVPWAVFPIMLYTFGLALTIPGLTILALDIFPEKRGLAASVQGVVQSLCFTLIAAIVAPILFGSATRYAMVMALLFTLNVICICSYRRLR